VRSLLSSIRRSSRSEQKDSQRCYLCKNVRCTQSRFLPLDDIADAKLQATTVLQGLPPNLRIPARGLWRRMAQMKTLGPSQSFAFCLESLADSVTVWHRRCQGVLGAPVLLGTARTPFGLGRGMQDGCFFRGIPWCCNCGEFSTEGNERRNLYGFRKTEQLHNNAFRSIMVQFRGANVKGARVRIS